MDETDSDLDRATEWFAPRFFAAPDLPVTLAAVLPNRDARAAPGFPAAALPEAGRIASGRGLTREDALRTALGEAVELVSCCSWGDDYFAESALNEGDERLSARELIGLSDEQYLQRDRWNALWGDVDYWPPPPAEEGLDWVRGTHVFDRSAICAPADLVFIGGTTGHAVNALGSTGCASGRTPEAAQDAALYELIERDAIGRWWWGGEPLKALSFELLQQWPDLLHAVRDRRRMTKLFAMKGLGETPCVAAISHNKDGGALACGFSAKPTWRDASLAAVLELADGEFRLRIASKSPENRGLQVWLDCLRVSDRRFQTTQTAIAPEHAFEPFVACAERGIDVVAFELSRAIMGAPAVRLMTVCLLPQQPRFLRLVDGLHWLSKMLEIEASEDDHAAVPLIL